LPYESKHKQNRSHFRANSDVAKQCIIQYLEKGFSVIAASRNTKSLEDFITSNNLDKNKISVLYFDAADFDSHQGFIPDFL
jgi:DNA replication protein DnaC